MAQAITDIIRDAMVSFLVVHMDSNGLSRRWLRGHGGCHVGGAMEEPSPAAEGRLCGCQHPAASWSYCFEAWCHDVTCELTLGDDRFWSFLLRWCNLWQGQESWSWIMAMLWHLPVSMFSNTTLWYLMFRVNTHFVDTVAMATMYEKMNVNGVCSFPFIHGYFLNSKSPNFRRWLRM